MEDLASVKERISKLLAKAEKTDNEHEREAFMAKVQEMLEAYQLEMLDVRNHAAKDRDPLSNKRGDVASSDAWIFRVTGGAALYFGAKIMWEKQDRNNMKRKPYRVFGRESAIAVFELMLPYFLSQVKQQGRRMCNEMGGTVSKCTREVGLAFSDRLRRLAAEADIHRAAVSRNALVPLDVSKEVTTAAHAYYSKVTPMAKLKTGFTHDAKHYANAININAQVGADKRERIG